MVEVVLATNQIPDGTFRVRLMFYEGDRLCAVHGIAAKTREQAERAEARARGALQVLGIPEREEARAA